MNKNIVNCVSYDCKASPIKKVFLACTSEQWKSLPEEYKSHYEGYCETMTEFLSLVDVNSTDYVYVLHEHLITD